MVVLDRNAESYISLKYPVVLPQHNHLAHPVNGGGLFNQHFNHHHHHQPLDPLAEDSVEDYSSSAAAAAQEVEEDVKTLVLQVPCVPEKNNSVCQRKIFQNEYSGSWISATPNHSD